MIRALKNFTLLLLILVAAPSFAEDPAATPRGIELLKKSTDLALVDPTSSLRLLQEVKEHKQAAPWQVDMMEGFVLYYNRHYRKAEKVLSRALNDDDISEYPEKELQLKRWLMKVHDVLGNDRELMYSIDELKKEAEDAHIKEFAIIADFTFGKRLHYHGYKAKGYRQCWDAIKAMSHSKSRMKHREMFRFYTSLIRMLIRDHRYNEALRLSYKQEQEARLFKNGMRYANQLTLRQTYANRTEILMKLHRRAAADSAYNVWKTFACGNAIDDKDILPYLIDSHRHYEALDVIHRYEDFLTNEDDSLSEWMLAMRINEGLVTSHLGDFTRTNENFRHMRTIIESMAERKSRKEMKAAYSNIKDSDMLELRSRWLIYVSVVGALLLIMVMIAVHYNRIIRRRNKLLQQTLNGLNAYRNVSFGQKTTGETAADGEESELAPSDDERLFVEMDRRVTHDRLFLNPSLSRDDLMSIMGVGKNRFVSIMGRFCDEDNVTQYINQKRLEYATQLMRRHPNYTLQAIMQECGMTNTATFNRAFKHFYGVTPSEYRNSLEEKTIE